MFHLVILLLATRAAGESPMTLAELQSRLVRVGFPRSVLTEARAGKVVTRVIPQAIDNAAFIEGVTWIDAEPERLIERIRSLGPFPSDRVLQSGHFSVPPRSQDLQPLQLDPQDLRAFVRCRAGDCDLQLDRAGMKLAGSAGGSLDRAPHLMKEALLQLLNAYLDDGSCPVYEDNVPSTSLSRDFAFLVDASSDLVGFDPQLFEYLRSFPRGAEPIGVESLMSWSKQRMRQAVVSLIQVVIRQRQGEGRRAYVVISKHLYDSRHFLAYFDCSILVPDPDGRRGFYLVRSVRALIDPPRSWRDFLLGKIRRGMRSALRDDLDLLRRSVN
jgi:hypothetical protein